MLKMAKKDFSVVKSKFTDFLESNFNQLILFFLYFFKYSQNI